MKNIYLLFLFIICLILSCNSKDEEIIIYHSDDLRLLWILGKSSITTSVSVIYSIADNGACSEETIQTASSINDELYSILSVIGSQEISNKDLKHFKDLLIRHTALSIALTELILSECHDEINKESVGNAITNILDDLTLVLNNINSELIKLLKEEEQENNKKLDIPERREIWTLPKSNLIA
jgi:hypothetical protein